MKTEHQDVYQRVTNQIIEAINSQIWVSTKARKMRNGKKTRAAFRPWHVAIRLQRGPLSSFLTAHSARPAREAADSKRQFMSALFMPFTSTRPHDTCLSNESGQIGRKRPLPSQSVIGEK